jgi:hypothetical protein
MERGIGLRHDEWSVDEGLRVLGYRERFVVVEEGGFYGFPGHIGMRIIARSLVEGACVV